MDYVNKADWCLALAFCLLFFVGGRLLAESALARRGATGAAARRNLGGGGPGGFIPGRRAARLMRTCLFLCALPSLLFPLSLCLPALARSPVYCAFRAVNRSELFAALAAPFLAYITWLPASPKLRRRPVQNLAALGGASLPDRRPPPPPLDPDRPGFARRAFKALALPLCLAYVSLCFARPLLLPASATAAGESGAWAAESPARAAPRYENNWIGGALTQSLASNGGAAALASALFKLTGEAPDEQAVSEGAYTDATGNDIWYLARYASSRAGARYRFMRAQNLAAVPAPAVLQASTPDPQSPRAYVAILSNDPFSRELTVADPRRGRLYMTYDGYLADYGLDGAALCLSAANSE